MQHRMKEFMMSKEAIEVFLSKTQVGRISTINEDGYPYTVAVHFIFMKDNVYFHGLPKGQKLDNIRRCSKVCFEADEMTGLMLDRLVIPCKADTAYESVVIMGTAEVLTDPQEKEIVFSELIKKYAPQYLDMEIPENMISGTAVVRIASKNVTGKYHE